MADNVLKTRLISAHNTTSFWATCVQIPYKGEVCYGLSDSGDILEIKIGNGIDTYAQLPAFSPQDTNFYTTAFNQTTAASNFTATVVGNDASVTGDFTISGATTASAGVMTTAQVKLLSDLKTSAVTNVSTASASGKLFKLRQTKNGTASDIAGAVFGSASTATVSGTTADIESATASSGAVPNIWAIKQYVESKMGIAFQTTVVIGTTTADLPATGDPNTIYFLKASSTAAKSLEYIWVDSAYDLIGDTSIDPGVTEIDTTGPITKDQATGKVTIGHNVSGVTSATYGSATSVAQVTVDEFGHVTSAKNVAITFPTDKHTYLTSSNFTSSANANTVDLKIVTSGTSAATATASIPSFTNSNAGIVAPSGTTATNKFLRSDNTWQKVPLTDYYTTAVNVTTSSAGFSATVVGNNSAVGGEFSIPAAQTTVSGVMTTAQVSKLNGIEDEANKYVHPSAGQATGQFGATAAASGWGATVNVPSVTIDSDGHVTTANQYLLTFPSSSDSALSYTMTGDNAGLYLNRNGSAVSTVSTVSTDILRNGVDTLILNGNFTTA